MKKKIFAISAFLFGTVALHAHVANSPIFVDGASNIEEKQALNSLVQASYNTLRSKNFRTNLLLLEQDYPEIFLRMDEESSSAVNGSVQKLIEITQSSQPFRYANASVALVGSVDNYMALAGVTGNNKDGSFALGRGHLQNWLSKNVTQRSCAVNTAAHELSHLITSDPVEFRTNTQPVKDNGAAQNSNQNAVASYLIGTAAQCTWLQDQGYLPKVNFKTCVKVFGHRGFNGGRCRQFSKNSAIELRNDLYPEHVIQ